MPKIKTNSSAAKRFKRTKSGKVLYKNAFRRHKLTKKSAKRKRQLRKTAVLDPSDMKRIDYLLPYR